MGSMFSHLGVPLAWSGLDAHRPGIRQIGPQRADQAAATLRVLTLNLAHARGNHLVQRLVLRREAERQLDRVAVLLRQEAPQVVALQEADAKAFWSGRFNHVHFLAQRAGFASYTQMPHVERLGLAYGTALMADTDLREDRGSKFHPTPPSFTKGWVSAVLPWHAVPGGAVRLVSLHLDFARSRSRQSQLAQLALALRLERLPLVLMGDFNCELCQEPAMLNLMQRLGLHAFEPEAGGPATFPATGKRLDWILISRDLRFVRHDVLSEAVSDHLPVAAELAPQ